MNTMHNEKSGKFSKEIKKNEEGKFDDYIRFLWSIIGLLGFTTIMSVITIAVLVIRYRF